MDEKYKQIIDYLYGLKDGERKITESDTDKLFFIERSSVNKMIDMIEYFDNSNYSSYEEEFKTCLLSSDDVAKYETLKVNILKEEEEKQKRFKTLIQRLNYSDIENYIMPVMENIEISLKAVKRNNTLPDISSILQLIDLLLLLESCHDSELEIRGIVTNPNQSEPKNSIKKSSIKSRFILNLLRKWANTILVNNLYAATAVNHIKLTDCNDVDFEKKKEYYISIRKRGEILEKVEHVFYRQSFTMKELILLQRFLQDNKLIDSNRVDTFKSTSKLFKTEKVVKSYSDYISEITPLLTNLYTFLGYTKNKKSQQTTNRYEFIYDFLVELNILNQKNSKKEKYDNLRHILKL
jgi:hypothetical protein